MGAGNITSSVEFNVWTDPEAAYRLVTESGPAVHLVGLDVTRRATLDEGHRQLLRARSPAGALLASMIDSYQDRRLDGWRLHDVLVSCALNSLGK